jgi:hypothetical protein
VLDTVSILVMSISVESGAIKDSCMLTGACRRSTRRCAPPPSDGRCAGHRIKAVRALRAATTLKFQQERETITFDVLGIADYEVVALV